MNSNASGVAEFVWSSVSSHTAILDALSPQRNREPNWDAIMAVGTLVLLTLFMAWRREIIARRVRSAIDRYAKSELDHFQMKALAQRTCEVQSTSQGHSTSPLEAELENLGVQREAFSDDFQGGMRE